MTQVTEHIFVGNSQDEGNGCTGVLNVAYDLDRNLPEVEYRKVGLRDGGGNDAGQFALAVASLKELLESHDRVLVHCHEGKSRSPTVIALYLATVKGIRFVDAVDLVKSRRTQADPHKELLRDAELALPVIIAMVHRFR